MRRALTATDALIKAREENQSVFLPLGQLARMGFLFYLVAYRVVFPLMAVLMNQGAHDLLALRFTAELFYTCLLAYPFIFYRKEYGWLHPLVLPTIYSLGKALAKSPIGLILPFDFPMIDFDVETGSTAAVLSMSNIDLAWTRLELSLVYCLAQSSYLLAFLFAPRMGIRNLTLYKPKSIGLVSIIFIGALMGIAMIFVVMQGGIQELLVSMRGGRVALFEGQGQFLVAGVAATTIATAWLMYEKRPWLNPLFIAGLIGSLLTALLTSGSRSAMVLPIITILLLAWKRRGKVLVGQTVTVALFGLLVLGVFGSIRQDFHSTTVDLSVLDPTNYGTAISHALTETSWRKSEESDLAVVAGTHEKGLLWGRTYIGALAFWVPRAMWPDKPRTADAYNMWVNFGDHSIDAPLRNWGLWGIPVSGELEAYWNFSIVGVVIVFGLLGIFHATLARAAYVYRHVGIFWAVYIIAVTRVTGNSQEIVDFARNVSVLIIYAYFAGIIRFGNTGAIRNRVKLST